MNIENIPELSGSPAQGDQQDLVDKGIVKYPGNSKQGDSVQDNSDQKQCRQGQECGVVLDVKQLNEVAIHDIHDDSAEAVSEVGVGDVCFFLTMRCFNDAMFSNS